MRASIVVLGIAFVVGSAGVALADGAVPAGRPSKEVADLIGEIDRDEAMLATEGCAVACQALTSMRRAVDRLCDLDAGARCVSARDRVRGAEERVRSTCPECGAVGGMPPPVVAVSPGIAPAPPAPTAQGNKPAAVDEIQVRGSRGGCAGCTVGDDDNGVSHQGTMAALLLAAAWLRRRRRTKG